MNFHTLPVTKIFCKLNNIDCNRTDVATYYQKVDEELIRFCVDRRTNVRRPTRNSEQPETSKRRRKKTKDIGNEDLILVSIFLNYELLSY